MSSSRLCNRVDKASVNKIGPANPPVLAPPAVASPRRKWRGATSIVDRGGEVMVSHRTCRTWINRNQKLFAVFFLSVLSWRGLPSINDLSRCTLIGFEFAQAQSALSTVLVIQKADGADSASGNTSIILQGHEDPPCHACLFLVWAGKPTIPFMYELCLKSAIKVYGRENIVVLSSVIEEPKDWYPAIWNVTAIDLINKLTTTMMSDESSSSSSSLLIHNKTVWNNFLGNLTSLET